MAGPRIASAYWFRAEGAHVPWAEIFQRELEEQLLTGPSGLCLGANRLIVETGVADGVVKDAWIGCESGDGQLAYVALERAAGE